MDLLKLFVSAVLVVCLMSQAVLTGPVAQSDTQMALPRALRSAMTVLRQEDDAVEPSVLINRLKRSGAQWMVGRYHYGHNRNTSNRSHRRHHRRHHISGGGRLVSA